MREKLSEFPPVLKEVILGILIFGGIMQAGLMWFSSDKALFTSGLWIGVLTAVFMICHMYNILDQALEMTADMAKKHVRKGYAFRFSVIVAVFLVMYYLKIGNAMAFFLGLFTLKFSAYLQPLIHQILTKKKKGG